jgi:ABC-type nitrate/sulfonate/bicarbonate transport system ATPase subunit
VSGLDIDIREKRFGETAVLADVHIVVEDGEFVAIVGPSGAGKSTLLSMVAGLDTRFAGAIGYNGGPLSEPGRSPAGMGMMFQEPRLMPWLNARQNVLLAEAEHMSRDRSYVSKAGALLEEVGLAGSGEVWPSQLSGGMQRRVALARAFVVEPWLLLMDEPFVSLDMPTGNRLRRALRQLCKRRRPLVLFVTHDLREAIALADRILFLGGTPAQVKLDYRVELTGEHNLESAEVAAVQHRLLDAYPQLLSGLLESGSASARDKESL